MFSKKHIAFYMLFMLWLGSENLRDQFQQLIYLNMSQKLVTVSIGFDYFKKHKILYDHTKNVMFLSLQTMSFFT